jgi:MFS family permease
VPSPWLRVRSSAYIPLLRIRAVRLEALSGLVAQVTQGAAGVGTVLVVRQRTGSLPLAGAVVGVLSIAAGVSRPVQGRLIDVRGPVGVLVGCGIVHPAALIGIVGLADADAPGALLIVLGVLAGLALPPVSTSMRARWGEFADKQERTAAYSLVYLVQELSILAGPLILAVLIAVSSRSASRRRWGRITRPGRLGTGPARSRTRPPRGPRRPGSAACCASAACRSCCSSPSCSEG